MKSEKIPSGSSHDDDCNWLGNCSCLYSAIYIEKHSFQNKINNQGMKKDYVLKLKSIVVQEESHKTVEPFNLNEVLSRISKPQVPITIQDLQK